MRHTRTTTSRRTGATAALLCSAVLLASGCSSGDSSSKAQATPPDDYGCLTPAQASAGSITIDNDGTPLDAYVEGDGKVGIVFSHQLGSDLCEWLDYFPHFTERGYRLIAFTMDDSDPTGVLAAAQELVHRGSQKVVLVGGSKGGTASLAAAGDPGRVNVAGVVTLSSPQQFGGTDALAAAGKLKVPAFFAAESNDLPYADDIRGLYKADHDSDKVLKVYDGGNHGVSILKNGTALADVTAFLERYAPANG
ncbi:alpha/beta hydrolase family protein [Streptomyces sp. NPDC003393]